MVIAELLSHDDHITIWPIQFCPEEIKALSPSAPGHDDVDWIAFVPKACVPAFMQDQIDLVKMSQKVVYTDPVPLGGTLITIAGEWHTRGALVVCGGHC